MGRGQILPEANECPFLPFLRMTGLDHLAIELCLESVDEVLYGLVVRVEDQALVTEADQLDVLHLKQEAAGGRPALGCWSKVNICW